VFLGYNNLHKGYKCHDVASGRVYISQDVVSYDSVFPFSALNPNAEAQLKSDVMLLHQTLAPLIPLGNAVENHTNNSQVYAEKPVVIIEVSNDVEESSYHFMQDSSAADDPDIGF
jgi:hypothetical protein